MILFPTLDLWFCVNSMFPATSVRLLAIGSDNLGDCQRVKFRDQKRNKVEKGFISQVDLTLLMDVRYGTTELERRII